MKKFNIADQIVGKIAALLRRNHKKAAHEAALDLSRQYGGAAADYLAAAEEEVAYATYTSAWKEVEKTRNSFRAEELRKELVKEATAQRRRLDKKTGGPTPSGLNWKARRIAIAAAFQNATKCRRVLIAAIEGVAALMVFVNGGCKALVTKTNETSFAFALQRFAGEEAPKYVHVLRKPEEVISVRSRILRKDVTAYGKKPNAPVDEYRGYSVAQLLLGNYKKKSGEIMETNKVFLTQVPASRRSPYIEGTVTKAQICGLTVDRFSKAFINVRVDHAADPQSILTKLHLGVWEANGKFYFHVGNKYVEVEQGAEFDSLPATAIHYGANSTASNGQIKSKEITLYAENLPGFDAAEMLDELTFGLVSQLKANRRESSNVKQVAQLSTRLAQPDAPAVEGGVHFHVEAYYMGIYNPLWDGESYVSANFAADWVEERLGRKMFHVLPSATKGLCFQARPHMVKGNSSVLSREALTDFLSSMTWKPVVIERTSVSPEEQKAFNEAVWSKGKNGSFAGKIVVICDHRSDIGRYGVELFTDLNGLKETFDLRTTSGLNVLDMTAEEEDLRRTSTQTFATYCVADYEKAKVLHDKAVKSMLEKKVSSLFGVEEDGILGDELASDSQKHLSIRAFDHEGVNWEDAARTVAPRFFSRVWHPGYKRIVSKMIEGLDTKLGRSNLDIEGTYGVIIVDPAIDYGFNSLRFDSGKCEVLAPALRDGTVGLMNRFPMANCFGQSKIVAVSKEELVDRAWRHAASEGDDLFDSLEYYVERINAVPEGVVVVPASQSLMNKHDGWDFDGDHVNIVTDDDYVALYDLIGSMIVDIESGESSKTACSVALDDGVTRKFWEMTVISPNPSVGEVINAFQVFSSVLVDAKAWKADIDNGEKSSHGKLARNVFSVVFNNHGGTVEHYQGLPRHEETDGLHVSVSADMAASAMDQMSSMVLTPENIIAAAEDMQAIARMYAETVIDAAKTGAHVVIERFKELKKIRPESREEIATKIVWDNKDVKIPYNRGAAVAVANKAKKVLVGDIFHELRVRGLKDTARLAKQLVAVEQTLPEATASWAKSRAQVLKKETEIVSFVREKLYMSLMSMQGDLVNEVLSMAGRDKALARQAEKAVKQPFKAMMGDVRDMLRNSLKDISYVDRVAISLAVAINAAEKSHKGMKADNFMSDFVSKLFEEEFFLFILMLGQQKSGKEVIGEVPQFTADKVSRVEGFADGDEVDFVCGEAVGANGEFALAKDPMLTGHFILKEEKSSENGSHWYATKSIRDLVSVPEGSNKVVFSTGFGDIARVKALARFVKPGQKVVLANKVTVDGKVCKNVVIINGKAAFSYKKDFCMESIYSGLNEITCGIVSSTVMSREGEMAIISLEGVKKISARELSSEKITWAKLPASSTSSKGKMKQAVNSYAPSFFKKKH